MNKAAATILVFMLVFAPSVASAKGRKGKHTATHKRAHASRRHVATACPPPVVIVKPDAVDVSSYDSEAQLQAAVAEWLNSTQPPMSEVATNAARGIALFWYRRGRASIK